MIFGCIQRVFAIDLKFLQTHQLLTWFALHVKYILRNKGKYNWNASQIPWPMQLNQRMWTVLRKVEWNKKAKIKRTEQF